MSFLNPDEQTRIKIRKPSPAPPPGTIPAAAAPGAPGAPKPGAPGIPGKGPLPMKPGMKPGSPVTITKAATNVTAIVKQKVPPKVEVLEVAPGIFEVHFSCSCGEQYLIRCESAEKSGEKPPAV